MMPYHYILIQAVFTSVVDGLRGYMEATLRYIYNNNELAELGWGKQLK
jgi:hypothetical protein